MTLFTPLPFGDGLERRDIPADELGERDFATLLLSERNRIFELDFPVPPPGHRSGAERKRLGFAMDDRLAHTLAHDRGSGSRRSLACVP